MHICTYILGECYAVATNKLQVQNQICLFLLNFLLQVIGHLAVYFVIFTVPFKE